MKSVVRGLILVGLWSCGDGSAPTAGTDGASAPASNQPPPPPADVDVELPELPEGSVFPVDVASSKIEFTGAKVTGSHDGGFSAFTGSVVLDGDEVLGTKFVIDMTTTSSDNAKLTKHLLSKDFFHAEKYPEATFVSSGLTPTAETGAVTHDVRGVLELHGKSRPLSFPATVIVGAMATTVEASFDINRQNWGVSYPGKPDNLIKDDVQIRLSLRFPTTAGGEADAGEASN